MSLEIPAGGTVIAICCWCGRFTWDSDGDALALAGWYDTEAKHLACPVHGTKYAAGFLVGPVNNPAALQSGLREYVRQITTPTTPWTIGSIGAPRPITLQGKTIPAVDFDLPIVVGKAPEPRPQIDPEVVSDSVAQFARRWWQCHGDEVCTLEQIREVALEVVSGDMLLGTYDTAEQLGLLRLVLHSSRGKVVDGRWKIYEQFDPEGFMLEELQIWDARNVPITVPCERCDAPGCGDKIKPFDPGDTMLELTAPDGQVRHIEHSCAGYWVHGHPDDGNPKGSIRWEDGTITKYDPNHWKRPKKKEPFGKLPSSGVTVTPIRHLGRRK